jgi:hypothetical protein
MVCSLSRPAPASVATGRSLNQGDAMTLADLLKTVEASATPDWHKLHIQTVYGWETGHNWSVDPVIAYVDLMDGTRRPVFEQLDGGQYMMDGGGQPVYGVWFIPATGSTCR